MEIKTAWHKLVEYARTNLATFRVERSPEIEGVDSCVYVTPCENKDLVLNILDRFQASPKFVLTADVISLVEANKDAFIETVKAMILTNKMRLPFKALVIEQPFKFTNTKAKAISLIEEVEIDQTIQYAIHNFYVVEDGEKVKRQALASSHSFICRFDLDSSRNAILLLTPVESMLIDKTKNSVTPPIDTDKNVVQNALGCALVLTHTRGIAHEKVLIPDKLNAKRRKENKEEILPYTILKIGTVYRIDGTYDTYSGTRKSMRVHFRRGHYRNVRHGQGRKLSKLMYIEPVLVNYVEGEAMPETVSIVKV